MNYLSRHRELSYSNVSVRSNFFVLLLFIGSIVASFPVIAEHENDHRYVVRGYILNQDESPIPSATVSVSATGVDKQDKTDSSGYFNMRLHLHDPDLGRKLQIKTDYGNATIVVDFDRGDLDTERIHYVNFIGGKLVEGSLNKKSGVAGIVPIWVYYLFAIVLFIIIAPPLIKAIKRFLKRTGSPSQPVAAKSKGKKSESKKTRTKHKNRKRR